VENFTQIANEIKAALPEDIIQGRECKQFSKSQVRQLRSLIVEQCGCALSEDVVAAWAKSHKDGAAASS